MNLKSFTRFEFHLLFKQKIILKRILFILFTLSLLGANAQEGISNIINNNATLGGGLTSYDGGIFIAHTSSQQRVIVTSAESLSSTPPLGLKDIDITLVDNNNSIVSHDVFGIVDGTLTAKDVIVDQFGYVVIVGKIVFPGPPGVGYDRGFILRMDLSNFATRTFATYDINSGNNDPWFHQILELNLSGSVYGGNRQMAILASANVGSFRQDFILLVDQGTLTLNSTTMLAMANRNGCVVQGTDFDSRVLTPGMEGFRTLTETDASNNSLAVSGAYIFKNTITNVYEYGIYILEFPYSSGTLSTPNQWTMGSGNGAPPPDWVLPHDMIFENNNNYGPTFYVAGSKLNPSLGNFVPCYFAYSFTYLGGSLIYATTISVTSPTQNLILGHTSSKMQLRNNEILVGNNRGDYYTFDKTSGAAGYIKSVTDAFRPLQSYPYGDFIYDNANYRFYGVTQNTTNTEMQLFTMLPNTTDACCFTVKTAYNSSFGSQATLCFSVDNNANGTMYSDLIYSDSPTVTIETLCAYCANNTMSISGPIDVYCGNKDIFTLQGCSHSFSGYWEIIGPLPSTSSCSANRVSWTNSTVTIDLSNPSLSGGQYKIRYIEDISSETGCLDVLAEKTINYHPCCPTSGTYNTVQASYKHSYTGKTLGVTLNSQDYPWVLQDLGTQEYSLSQVNTAGKIQKSYRYKGTSSDAFTAVDFTNSVYSPSNDGIVVAGHNGNKFYIVETDASGAIVRKKAHSVSACLSCGTVEVVNIVKTQGIDPITNTLTRGYAVLINQKWTLAGTTIVMIVHLAADLSVQWTSFVSDKGGPSDFYAHRLITYESQKTYGTTSFMILGTVSIDGVKYGIILDPKVDFNNGRISNPKYLLSNNTYFDGRAVYNGSGYPTGFIFGGSNYSSFSPYTNAAFLKTDLNLSTVYAKRIQGYHMHAIDMIPVNGSLTNSLVLLHSIDNTGKFFYHLVELNDALNIVGNTNRVLRQYKNTSNNHNPYIAGKNLLAQTSSDSYIISGQDDTEYDFFLALVEPNLSESCGTSFNIVTDSWGSGSVYTGYSTSPWTADYDLSVDKNDLPLKFVCCSDRNGATFTQTNIENSDPVLLIGKKRPESYGMKNSNVGDVQKAIGEAIRSSIQVLPNPSNGLYNIQFSLQGYTLEQLPDYSISVIDIIGKVVYFRNGLKMNTNEPFDLTELTKGVYTVQVVVGDSYKYIYIIKN